MQHLRKWKLLSALPLAFVLVGFGGVETWAVQHADAAKDLASWGKSDPTGVKKYVELDEQHPDQTKDMVNWAVSKNETLDQYATAHKGQPVANLISEHRAASDGLVGWARKHKDAAKQLVSYPKGLSRVGKHLFK